MHMHIGFVKIRKILSHKVGNTITMVVDAFWSTEVNFWPIPTHEGSIPVSDITLVHFQGPQMTSDVKKPVWVKSLVTRDRARTHISELSKGSLGTKIALKMTLEGEISTINGRVASHILLAFQSYIWIYDWLRTHLYRILWSIPQEIPQAPPHLSMSCVY